MENTNSSHTKTHKSQTSKIKSSKINSNSTGHKFYWVLVAQKKSSFEKVIPSIGDYYFFDGRADIKKEIEKIKQKDLVKALLITPDIFSVNLDLNNEIFPTKVYIWNEDGKINKKMQKKQKEGPV